MYSIAISVSSACLLKGRSPPSSPVDDDAISKTLKQILSLFQDSKSEPEWLISVPFIQELTFESQVHPQTVNASEYHELFDWEEFTQTKESIHSKETCMITEENGVQKRVPCYSLTIWSDSVQLCKIRCMKYLWIHFGMTSKSSLRQELRWMISRNRSIMEVLFGNDFDDINTVLWYRNVMSTATEEEKGRFGLLTFINQIDMKLHTELLSRGDLNNQITMDSVEAELNMLKECCGDDSTFALRSIGFETDYLYASGLRAPPWQQVKGDLCYIIVGTHDIGVKMITCSSDGFFFNKGYCTDSTGNEKMNYERDSDSYPTLIDLLKAQSKHFDQTIYAQDVCWIENIQNKNDQSIDVDDALSFARGASVYSIDEHAIQEANESEGSTYSESVAYQQFRQTPTPDDRHIRKYPQFPRITALQQEDRPQSAPAASNSYDDFGANDANGWSDMRIHFPHTELVDNPRSGIKSHVERFREALTSQRPHSPRNTVHSPVSERGNHKAARSPRPNTPTGPHTPVRSRASSDAAVPSSTKSRLPSPRTPVSKSTVQTPSKSGDGYASSEDEDKETDALKLYQDIDTSTGTEVHLINRTMRVLKDTDNFNQKVIALTVIKNSRNSAKPRIQIAIASNGGIKALLALTANETDKKVRHEAASIARDISIHPQVQVMLAEKDNIELLVKALGNTIHDIPLRCIICDLFANMFERVVGRKTVRNTNGLQKLMDILHNDVIPLIQQAREVSSGQTPKKSTAQSGNKSTNDSAKAAIVKAEIDIPDELIYSVCNALWHAARNRKNRKIIRRHGGVTDLHQLFERPTPVLVPIIGILMECANEAEGRALIRELGGAEAVFRLMETTDDLKLQIVLAGALFKLCEDEHIRMILYRKKTIETLMTWLQSTDETLLENTIGALWKCCLSEKNALKLDSLGAFNILSAMLTHNSIRVKSNTIGTFAACSKIAQCRKNLFSGGASSVEQFCKLLRSQNAPLLINCCNALANSAMDDSELLRKIIDNDGIRMMFSLLRHSDYEVQSTAAYAIARCINTRAIAHEVGQALIGGLTVLTQQLVQDSNHQVIAGTCAAVSKMCLDEANRAVMSEEGIVKILAGIVVTHTNLNIQQHVALAIAEVCKYKNNRTVFYELGTHLYLVQYLEIDDPLLNRNTVCALQHLTDLSQVAADLRQHGVVQRLVRMLSSSDEVLQEAAASAITNIRLLGKCD